MEDHADLYVINASTGKLLDIEHIERDGALSNLASVVGILGSNFAYDKFAYQKDKGSYHCDSIPMPDGYNYHDIDIYFENGAFVGANGKRDMMDAESPVAFTLKADSYGSTTVKMPSYYS